MKRFSSITTTQLARICGVSQGTVDRALHDRGGISKETKERILAVAKEYEYVPGIGGKAVKGRSMLIGVVLYDLYNSFFSKLAMSFVKCAKREGYSVIFLFSNKDLKEEKAAIDYFNYIGVDGIVLFSVGSDDEEYLEYLHSVVRPIVMVGNRMAGFPYIGIDDAQAMYELSLTVLEKTQGEIVYFAPILKRELHTHNAQRERFEGFCRAVEERGRMWRLVTEEGELTFDVGGIVCSTDHYMLRVLRTLKTSYEGVLAGFDGVALSEVTDRTALTVEYPTDRIAAECMRFFLKRNWNGHVPYTITEHGFAT
ncbi:MAG: LacI family transcriptional regulator [Ruminococcaceae bacterium]|nr:LacI family transcriptional regulator [Oscillospiraceae bacterium]